MVCLSPTKLEAVPSSSTTTAERIALVASSRVTTRSSSGPCGSQACFEPSWKRSMPGQGPARPLLAVGRAFGRSGDETPPLEHALGPRVTADKQLAIRHRPPVDRLMEVLGREIEIAGAEFLTHPCDLVHARPPARGAAAPAVDDPLCPPLLIGIAQPAEMPLAHPQQRPSLHAAQLLLPMQLNRISDPGHPDLRQHAIPPAKTGQIVCSQTRTYLVSATPQAAGVVPRPGACGRRRR